MRVSVDEVTGVVTLVFAPSHQEEAKRVLEYAICLYRREGADVTDILALQDILKSNALLIQ